MTAGVFGNQVVVQIPTAGLVWAEAAAPRNSASRTPRINVRARIPDSRALSDQFAAYHAYHNMIARSGAAPARNRARTSRRSPAVSLRRRGGADLLRRRCDADAYLTGRSDDAARRFRP